MPAINNEPNKRGVYVNTTDGTAATAATFTTQSNKAYLAIAKVIATETADFDEVAGYVRAATFKNDGGTLTLIGSVTDVATHESTSAWNVTLDADGDDIRVRVTGAASTAISWKVDLEVLEAGKYVAEYGIAQA